MSDDDVHSDGPLKFKYYRKEVHERMMGDERVWSSGYILFDEASSICHSYYGVFLPNSFFLKNAIQCKKKFMIPAGG